MRKWLITALVVVVTASLAGSAGWWLPPLLTFVGANSELIQGLTDLTQLVLWVVAGLTALLGIWRSRRQDRSLTLSHVDAQGNAAVATHGSVAARQIAVGHDVYGDVILVANPEQLWQVIGKSLPPDDLRKVTESYLRHLVDRYRYLDFRGMGVSDRVPLRLPLAEMYIPLKVRIELPEGETWPRQLHLAGRQVSDEEIKDIGHRLGEPRPVLSLLQQHDGLIILGDPGAGKTTFLKYLTLCLASGETEALGLRTRLPILLPLSAYATALANRDLPLDHFIAQYYHDRGVDLPIGSMLAEALDRGAALLLLDGLDEVKDLAQRHLVVERVMDFYTFHRQQHNKFILTSRIVGYREVRPTAEGLAECTLVDFEDEDISQFVDKWTGALERAARGDTPVARQEALREREELLTAIQRNSGVKRLAANPLLLTILALMKRQGVALPERRVELYYKYVETLLKHWNLARGLDRPHSRDLDVVETVRVLAPLALWMHETSPEKGLVKREEMRRRLEEIYTQRGIPDPERAARQLQADAREYAGLLLERGPGEYGFIHLTFQEYLAAVAIALRGQQEIKPVVDTLSTHVGDDNWHEVALLTIGHMGIVQQRDEAAGVAVWELIQAAPGEPGQAVLLAGEAVVDAWPGGVTPACKTSVTQVAKDTLADDARVKPLTRAAIGRTLAKLGDPRFLPGTFALPGEPLLGFVEVPAGTFVMGTCPEDIQALMARFGGERQWYEWETPQHQLDLPLFYIARYPTTNAQFNAFVKAGGYREQRYWREAEACGRWKDGKIKRRYYVQDEKDKIKLVEGEESNVPVNYGEPFDLPSHPVVGITWYEALAYTRWLTDQLRDWPGTPEPLAGLLRNERWVVTLPSEVQWEKAARGQDGRLFPWGDDPDPNRANYSDTGIGATSAVGCFPGGASPYGALDMSGNVWEWTKSLWGEKWQETDFKYPYDPNDSREDLVAGTEVLRVLRGGAFYDNVRYVRCASRDQGRSRQQGLQCGFPGGGGVPIVTLNSVPLDSGALKI